MIKALTGTLYATPEVSPRSSPTFGQLDAERSGRVNAIEGVPEAPTVTDARGKVELELRSPIVSFEGELRQERRLTLTEGLEQFQGVPRPFSEEKQNSEMSVLSHSRQSPAIVHGGERDAGGEYSQPFSALSNFHGGDRGLDRGSSTIPSPPFQPTAGRSPAGTAGFHDPESAVHHFAFVPHESVYKGFNEDLSSRLGRKDGGNVTQRDSKRPKERSRDKAYKTRFSMGSTVGASGPTHADFVTISGNGRDCVQQNGQNETPRSPGPPMQGWENGYSQMPSVVRGQVRASGASLGSFEIFLTHSGTTVVHRVWNEMAIAQLIMEAGSIFGLESAEIILILFSSQPLSLRRDGTIVGPPRVTPGSNVMVFQVHPPDPVLSVPYLPPTRAVSHSQGFQHSYHPELPAMSTKLLATFKLPKFDGVARSWKAWEKSFQRFLGIHGLDHVLEEDFPNILWTVPGAKASNKMVYFLIEDAVATGTLASKLVRQATKWHGHEAFTLLRNGYVFNGPQTATILLAELSNMRLLRDEDASTFCLRLVELIEDLELIPGDAAVYLTDIQKLGYLLSAIRHEKSLQAVYSQLQSEQLRGIVSFDQACRELHHRVEAMRADDFLDSRPGRALLSTEGKKHGQLGSELVKLACLAKDCGEMVQPYLPLCKLCYLQCMAGKTPSLLLRDNLGAAVFNSTTKLLDFPSAVPKSRFPKKGMKKGKKVLMAGLHQVSDEGAASSIVPVPQN